ncbi:MAG: hypothetical protein RBR78_04205 [Flavobacteriaceae bacterium]|jgi:hypothetical protein|nr:hypothetical protein [Flavobacteriaceae bacterium]
MGAVGLELKFIFDKIEPIEKYLELREKYNFDARNGLNLIMTGEHWSEIEDEGRLMTMLEKKLNIDLSILDYWNEDDNGNFVDLDLLLPKLVEFKNCIQNNPDFYKEILYNIEDYYLKEQLKRDIEFLIERVNFNIQNGAKKVRFETL